MLLVGNSHFAPCMIPNLIVGAVATWLRRIRAHVTTQMLQSP